MMREKDLKLKEVINIADAERVGFVRDVEISADTGAVEALIIPRRPVLLSMLFPKRCRVIPWECIVKIGREIVLIDYTE